MDSTDAAEAQCVDANRGQQASSRGSDELGQGPRVYDSQAADMLQIYGKPVSLASSGWDIAVKVLKAQNERDLQAREDLFRLECKAVTRHVSALDAQLRDEKILRSSTLSGCKKLAAGIEERSHHIALLRESVGEALREVEKLESAAKQRKQELEEARASRQELEQQAVAAHKRVKDLKSQRNRAHEELTAVERSRRTVQTERDELREDLANAVRQVSLLRGETETLETSLLGMKEKLEDERNKTRLLTDTMREVRAQADQLSGELVAECGGSKRFADKAFVYERQSTELRAELKKVEEARKAEQRSGTTRLEARLAQAVDLLQQTEEGNRTSTRTIRQLERLLDITKRQVEDERRRAEELREDEDASSNRARELKTALDDAKSQHSQEKERRLKLQLELQEARKLHEKLTSELAACGEAWCALRQSDKPRKLH